MGKILISQFQHCKFALTAKIPVQQQQQQQQPPIMYKSFFSSSEFLIGCLEKTRVLGMVLFVISTSAIANVLLGCCSGIPDGSCDVAMVSQVLAKVLLWNSNW